MQQLRTNVLSHLAGGRVTFRPRSSWLAGLLGLALGLMVHPPRASAAPPASVQRMAQDEGGAAADTDLAVDYLWVLRNSLIHSEDIPSIIERAQRMHVRGLLVQV